MNLRSIHSSATIIMIEDQGVEMLSPQLASHDQHEQHVQQSIEPGEEGSVDNDNLK